MKEKVEDKALSRLYHMIDRMERYSHKTVHAPNYVLVLKSDLDNLIRERRGEVKS